MSVDMKHYIKNVVLSGVLSLTLLTSTCGQQLNIGDNCPLKDGGRGVCRRTAECTIAQEVLESKSNKTLMVCYYDFGEPIVCCESNPVPQLSKSEEKCLEYASAVSSTVPPLVKGASPVIRDQCFLRSPIRQKRIVGGTKTLPKEFPHMAALGFGEAPNITWLCAGSLISPRYVLTTGVCLFSRSRGTVNWVRLGNLNLAEPTDGPRAVTYAVEQRIPHPNYKSSTVYDDIALLKLSEDVEFNAYVRPACLNNVKTTPQGETATATGWGVTSWLNNERSDDLMKVDLQYDNPLRCNESYAAMARSRKLARGYTDDTMICAGHPQGHRDTCTGDSGGPLQVLLQQPYCMYSVVGLTSFGSRNCGESNTPSVYTRVSHYVPWIEAIVWPSE